MVALINAFIASITGYVSDNLGIVLTFTAGVLVWGLLKKYVFGGTRRI